MKDVRANARMVLINAEAKAYLPQVRVVGGVCWTRKGDGFLVHAMVRNNGTKALRYLQMAVSLLNSAGKVVDAVSGSFANPVPPGAIQEFEIVRRNPPRFRDVAASIEDIRLQ